MKENTIEVKKVRLFENKIWSNELRFYEDELMLLQHQLEQLVSRSDKKLLPSLEHFQNSFIRQKEVLDELKHDVKLDEQVSMQDPSEKKEIFGDRVLSHGETMERMKLFIKLFAEMKDDFVRFIGKII